MPSLVRWHHKGFQATAHLPKPVPTLWRYDADWRDSHPDTSASQDLSRAMRLRKIVGGLPLQALSISSPSRSQRGGLPKPRASNSAGAATTERGWSYSAQADSDQIGRGTANPHPTTPFRTEKKIGRQGHAETWGCVCHPANAKQFLALQTKPCTTHGRGQLERAVLGSLPTRLRCRETDIGHMSESGLWWP